MSAELEQHPLVDTSDQVILDPRVRVGLMMARLLRTYDTDSQSEPSDEDLARGYREPVTDGCNLRSELHAKAYTAFRLRGTRTLVELDDEDIETETTAVCIELEYCERPPMDEESLVDCVTDDQLPWQQYVMAVLQHSEDAPTVDYDIEDDEVAVELLWRSTSSPLDDIDVKVVHGILIAIEQEMLSMVDASALEEVPRPYDIFVSFSNEHALPMDQNGAVKNPVVRRLLLASMETTGEN